MGLEFIQRTGHLLGISASEKAASVLHTMGCRYFSGQNRRARKTLEQLAEDCYVATAKKASADSKLQGGSARFGKAEGEEFLPSENNALLAYTNLESEDDFHQVLREGVKKGKELTWKETDKSRKIISHVAQIDNGFEKRCTTVDMEGFRGIRHLTWEEAKQLVNTIYEDASYGSASLKQEVAESFSNGVILKLDVPKGSKAILFDKNMSHFGDAEEELLLPRGHRAKITGYTETRSENGEPLLILQGTLLPPGKVSSIRQLLQAYPVNDFIQHRLNQYYQHWLPQLTEQEQTLARDKLKPKNYNRYLRGESTKNQAIIQARVQDLDGIMEQSATPEDMTMFMKPRELRIADVVAGKTIQDKGYTQLSPTQEAAVDWANNALVQVEVPKGSPGLWLDGIQGGYSDTLSLGRNNYYQILEPTLRKMTDPQGNEQTVKVTQIKLLKAPLSG